jgi:glycopeptide antibiotics resistance protein
VDRVRWVPDRRVVAALGAAYLLLLVLVVTGPWGWTLNRLTVRLYTFFRYDVPLAPDWALPEHYGYLLNVLLFVPLGVLLVVVVRCSWWWAACIGTLVSAVVEVVQSLWLPRDGDLLDVVANGLGALLGAVVARLAARAVLSPRRPRR